MGALNIHLNEPLCSRLLAALCLLAMPPASRSHAAGLPPHSCQMRRSWHPSRLLPGCFMHPLLLPRLQLHATCLGAHPLGSYFAAPPPHCYAPAARPPHQSTTLPPHRSAPAQPPRRCAAQLLCGIRLAAQLLQVDAYAAVVVLHKRAVLPAPRRLPNTLVPCILSLHLLLATLPPHVPAAARTEQHTTGSAD